MIIKGLQIGLALLAYRNLLNSKNRSLAAENKTIHMSLVVVGSMAFDAIETPFGKSDKIIGGAATYIAWCASNFTTVKQISVVGGDFPQSELDALANRGVILEGVQIKKDEKSFRDKME